MSEDFINEQEDLLLFGDITDFDLFKAQVQNLFLAISSEFDKKLAQHESLIEKLEQQFAMIYAGYVEQAAVIENLLISFFTDNPEKEHLFRENLANARQQFLNLLKEGVEDVLAGEDQRTADNIKSVVDKKLSN